MARPFPAALLLVTACAAFAQGPGVAPGDAGCRAELVTETTTVRPGTELSVGVRLVLAPGWHASWVYPGDAGAAPVVEWTLPDGWVAGPLAWPVPRRLEQDGWISYVYEGQAVLTAVVAVPAGAPAGDAVLRAVVRWVACSDEECTSGRDLCEVKVTVREEPPVPDPVRGTIFKAARAALPRDLPEGAATFGEGAGEIVLDVQGLTGSSVEFYPLDPLTLDERKPAVLDRSDANGLRIRLVPAPRRTEPVSRLDGVLLVHHGGSTSAWVLRASPPGQGPR